MRTYVLRRVLIAITLLLGLLTINFFIIHMAPGDPTDIYENPDMTPEARENIRRAYGLDKPLIVQYFKYIEAVFFRFEFGQSIAKKRPVADELAEALPNTLQLAFLALCIEMVVGIAVGIIAAIRQYSWMDNTIRVATLTFYSMPSFYLGLLFLYLFAGGVWSFMPASGMIDIARHSSMNWGEQVWDRFVHLILPAITLGVGGAAAISRYMRGQLLEVVRQDYIRTARAKGLRERTVVFRHGVRNALMPIITILGLNLPVLLGGAVIVETVFAWPGMGRVAVEAAFQRDYPVFLAVNMIAGTLVIVGSLLADVMYALIDPRVRLA
jgi:peptide/nickel transport system permease protein